MFRKYVATRGIASAEKPYILQVFSHYKKATNQDRTKINSFIKPKLMKTKNLLRLVFIVAGMYFILFREKI